MQWSNQYLWFLHRHQFIGGNETWWRGKWICFGSWGVKGVGFTRNGWSKGRCFRNSRCRTGDNRQCFGIWNKSWRWRNNRSCWNKSCRSHRRWFWNRKNACWRGKSRQFWGGDKSYRFQCRNKSRREREWVGFWGWDESCWCWSRILRSHQSSSRCWSLWLLFWSLGGLHFRHSFILCWSINFSLLRSLYRFHILFFRRLILADAWTRFPGSASCHQTSQSSRDIISFLLLYGIMFEGEHRHLYNFWNRCWFRFRWFWGHGCRGCCRVFFSRNYPSNHSAYHLYHLLTGPTQQVLCELWLTCTSSSLNTAIEVTINFAFSIL